MKAHFQPKISLLGGGGDQLSEAKIYSPFGELIPNLTKFAQNNINFSANDAVGGFTPVFGATWTIAGIVASMCAIPINIPIAMHHFTSSIFLDGAVCVSDILDTLGYKQTFLQGSSSDYTAKRHFFRAHKLNVISEEELRDLGHDIKKDGGFWGFRDGLTFKQAKKLINEAKSPFALYILSVDTHADSTFINDDICPNLAPTHENTIKCSDKIIADFINFVRQSKFGANTTIVVVGDHFDYEQNFFPNTQSKRFVYNLFINAKFENFDKNLTKNRHLSHFDIAPLLLSSVGINAQKFGLGRNPLHEKTLLESIGLDRLNGNLKQKSKIYNSFWTAK